MHIPALQTRAIVAYHCEVSGDRIIADVVFLDDPNIVGTYQSFMQPFDKVGDRYRVTVPETLTKGINRNVVFTVQNTFSRVPDLSD